MQLSLTPAGLPSLSRRGQNENAGTPQDVHVLASQQLAPVKSCGPQTSADTPFSVVVEQAGELEHVAVWGDGGVGVLFQFEELSRSPLTGCVTAACRCGGQRGNAGVHEALLT